MKTRFRAIFLTQACLLMLPVGQLQAAPLFKNSVVSNDIDFIRSDDPSASFKVVELDPSRKEMPDKRSDELFMDGVRTFQLRYEDDASVEVWAAPALGDAAARYASLVGTALGKLPKPLRQKLSHVIVHSGDEVSFGEEQGRFLVLYSQNIEKRVSTHDLEETIFHEIIHATLEAEHAKSPAWIKAQKSDPGFITDYAAAHPKKEDLAESALFAYTLTRFPDRLPKEVESAVRKTMPNRLEYLRKLFESFEVKHKEPSSAADNGPFVFAYFMTGKSGEGQGLQLAYSRDGYEWKKIAAHEGSFLNPEVGGKLMRDPSVVRGPDGTFHMVWTTDWWRQGIGIAHSKDLINWSKQEYLDVMKDFDGYINSWAPEISFDTKTETYLIYWASTVLGKFPETEGRGEVFNKKEVKGVKANHRMYLTTTKDFETYTPTELFYDDGYSCIDAFIIHDAPRDRHVMIIKDEERLPTPKKDIRIATAKSALGPWSKSSPPISPSWVEGPAMLKVGDDWLLYYDAYTRKRYEGLKTRDFETWTSITKELKMPEGIRHGTPFPVSEAILQGLLGGKPEK